MRNAIVLFAMTALASLLGCSSENVDSEGPYDQASFEQKPGAHFVGDPTCVQTSPTSLTCSGSVAGLGNRAVRVSLDVTRVCVNRGDNEPPGQVSATSGPIQPENGRIDFSVTVDAACHDKMTAIFQSPATITILQGNTEVFEGTISF